STVFYTDGSKIDHGTYVGAAVFSPQLHAELMFRLSSYTSVFSAEAYAIYTAITISIDLHLRKVTIVTDSKSVLETISSYNNRTNNYLIPLIKAVLEEAEANGTRIQFVWVPSHKGIAGNEKADNLAKRAIRQGIEPNFKVPYSDICAVIKQRISDNFYRHLESMAQTK
ncbi:ribonuclease H1, partial [Mycetomoellerius zeteki]|uniref:ribonuclease H1 n=1 Tax=Mycetomoellerius zeteki TaxID=64791 RepID=UPI00084E430B